ncbi:MAG: hypothetical protein WCK65_09515 [Rhodospirillaceae bacterium]
MAGPLVDTISGELLPGARLAIAVRYVESVSAALFTCKLSIADAEISKRELAEAIAEANIDLIAMYNRRSRTHGLTAGKIAGIIAFRLSRHKILHFNGSAVESPWLFYVQDFAALHLVTSLILRKSLPATCFREVAYQMSRRHANQETLGVIFDNFP